MANKIRVMHFAQFGATNLFGTREQSMSGGQVMARPLGDGNTRSLGAFLQSDDPRLSVRTFDLKGALDAVAVSGTSFANVRIYDAELARDGTKETSSVIRHTMSNAFVIPRTLDWSQDSEGASIVIEAEGYDDSGASPIVHEGGQSLPAGAAGVANIYHLERVRWEGGDVESVSAVSIDFGIQNQPLRTDGAISPRERANISVLPVMRFTSHDLAQSVAVGRAEASSGLGLQMWFRQRGATGPLSGRILLTGTGVLKTITTGGSTGAINRGDFELSVIGNLVYDGTASAPPSGD